VGGMSPGMGIEGRYEPVDSRCGPLDTRQPGGSAQQVAVRGQLGEQFCCTGSPPPDCGLAGKVNTIHCSSIFAISYMM